MFNPDGKNESLLDLNDSRGEEKKISHPATRFQAKSQIENSNIERIHTQLAWEEMRKATPALFNRNRESTPQMNMSSYVDAVPSPSPNDINQSELFTWGQIEGTPLLLESSKSFKIPPTPKRELLAHKLSEKTGKNMKKNQIPPSLTLPTSSKRMLSPAATNLLRRTTRKSSAPYFKKT
jgi:protein DGCR14